jgi:uncharacterized protein YndB with AHSA1/START domain
MTDIIHRVAIKAPPSKVYSALATIDGIAGWWTRETTGVSKPGSDIDVRFSNHSGDRIGGMTMEVTRLDPDKEVRWRFKDGPPEWIGTDVCFALSREGDYTVVRFGHNNWREAVEFTAHCSTKWATFLLSLRDLAETGRGQPSPDDIKIDNWN